MSEKETTKRFKDDFVGTGCITPLTDQVNDVLSCLNNININMPAGYRGIPPTLKFTGGGLVFDFGQALVFTLKNVKWVLTGSADFNTWSANVENGRLVIRVDADSV